MVNTRKDSYGEQYGCRNCAKVLKRVEEISRTRYFCTDKCRNSNPMREVQPWGVCKKCKPTSKSLIQKQKDQILDLMFHIATIALRETQAAVNVVENGGYGGGEKEVAKVIERHADLIWEMFKSVGDIAEEHGIRIGDRGDILNKASAFLKGESA